MAVTQGHIEKHQGGSGGRRGEGEMWKEFLLWFALEGVDKAG